MPFNTPLARARDVPIPQCLYKSIGAILLEQDMVRFDKFVKGLMERPFVDDHNEQPATAEQMPTARRTLFEYFFDINRAAWIAYDWIVPAYVHDIRLKFDEVFVPTIDSVRIHQMLNLLGNVSIGQITANALIYSIGLGFGWNFHLG